VSTTRANRGEQIESAVLAWPGMGAANGRRGEYSLRLGEREIGHLHGDRVVHFAFPRKLWSELLADGHIERHPIDKPGFAARPLRDDADVAAALWLLRLNYDRAVARYGLPAEEVTD
jgi:hypothetical protein